ncbi:hypothetical protein D0T49_12840 [Paludibacter sp. 221]|nr:hypothetical protein [Paludibacter sp. 221]
MPQSRYAEHKRIFPLLSVKRAESRYTNHAQINIRTSNNKPPKNYFPFSLSVWRGCLKGGRGRGGWRGNPTKPHKEKHGAT